MSDAVYKQTKALASQLTPAEMIELAAWLEAAAAEALDDGDQLSEALDPKDMYGSWSDVHATDEDNDQVRRETLSKPPHEDNQ